MSVEKIGLHDKALLSQVYDSFNTAITKLHKHQAKLESQVHELTGALSKKNEELSDILESLTVGLIVTDMNGHIMRCNRSALRLLEIDEPETIGQHINSFFPKPVLPIPLDQEGLAQVDRNFQQELVISNVQQEKMILASSTSLMHSIVDEQPYGIIINLEDISLLKRLQDDSERKNRLTAMGEIAANVAHEIRNPLGSIELFISMLRKDLEDDEEKTESILRIQSGIRSMNHIISNLLEYTKPRPIVRTRVDMGALIEEFIGFSGHIATYQGIELDTKIQAINPYLKGDYELLKQMLHNLFLNATQSMIDGGTLQINLENQLESEPEHIKLFNLPQAPPDQLELLVLRIQDEGLGMSEEIQRKIFDPFFTTKEKGTGLGMFLLRNIIDSHSGLIFVDSEVDRGTTVTVEFLAHQA